MIVCVVCCQHSKSSQNDCSFIDISVEKTKHSNTTVALKLFTSLHLQLLSGHLCSVCHHLLEEIDSFETQLKSLNDVFLTRLQSKNHHDEENEDMSMLLDEDHATSDNHDTRTIANETTNILESEKLAIMSENPGEFWSQSNNPEALKRYVDSGRVDTCFTITSTQRGEDLLLYQGHSYRKKSPKPTIIDNENSTSAAQLWKWRCTKHASKKDHFCRAQIASLDNVFILKDSLTSIHSHLPDYTSTKKQLIRERIREITTNHPTMKTIEILNNAEMLMAGESAGSFRDDRSLHRYIQRIRAKQHLVS